jgi:hypothetical protein
VQVKNKPCDRGSEHAFILGSMVCTVANNKMFHGAGGERPKGKIILLSYQCISRSRKFIPKMDRWVNIAKTS